MPDYLNIAYELFDYLFVEGWIDGKTYRNFRRIKDEMTDIFNDNDAFYCNDRMFALMDKLAEAFNQVYIQIFRMDDRTGFSLQGKDGGFWIRKLGKDLSMFRDLYMKGTCIE